MIELVCAVVFQAGIIRDISHDELKHYRDHSAPYVVFPCIMTDLEAWRFYAAHDPQLHGDYDPAFGYTQADR